MSQREIIRNTAPQLWKDRRQAGLCPVCGKLPQDFEPRMKVFCSHKCRDDYARHFTTWEELRAKILKRDDDRCQICHMNWQDYNEKFEAEYDKQHNQQIMDWLKNPKNAERLSFLREKALIRLSERYQEDYEQIMDDIKFFHHKYHEMEAEGIPYRGPRTDFSLEVDHIQAIVNDGDMWDENNLRTVCNHCHKGKTAEDMIKARSRKEVKSSRTNL